MTASPPQLRLLHVHDSFAPGVDELRRVALINRFGAAATHVIVSAVPGATAAIRHVGRGIRVQQGQLPNLAGRAGPLRLQALAQAMQGHDLILTYGRGAMNAVLAHTLFGPRLGLAPLVHHDDRLAAGELPRTRPGENATRMLALARVQALVVPSAELKRIALASWRQPAGKVHRIPPGVATGAYVGKPRRDALPRVIKRPGELFVGTDAAAEPDLRALIAAVAPLDEAWHLVVLGEVPQREAVLADAVARGVGHRLHLPGPVAEAARVLGLFDLFVPAPASGFPLSLVEAMAASRAITGYAGGEAADIVAAGNCRFLPSAGDEQGLAAALADLAGDPALRSRLGAENRARAVAEFDERVIAARHAKLYAEVLGRSSFP